jgi:hypothetical protein
MKRLCRRLDIPQWQAVGLLESIWHLTAKEVPRGNIGKLSNEDIAVAIDYRGDESELIEAMVHSGWLDRDPVERLIVHDWHEHADDAVQMKLARGRQYFVSGQAPKPGRLPKKEREAAIAFYAHDGGPLGIRQAHSVGTPCVPPEPEPEPEPTPEPTPPVQLTEYPLTTAAVMRRFATAGVVIVEPPLQPSTQPPPLQARPLPPGQRQNHPVDANTGQPLPDHEVIAAMRTALSDYPGSKHLADVPGVPPVPDDAIAIACLNAGRWDCDAIAGVLRQMHFERLHPSQSWAWFPAVLRKRLSAAPPDRIPLQT